jgi:hypothetical protein
LFRQLRGQLLLAGEADIPLLEFEVLLKLLKGCFILVGGVRQFFPQVNLRPMVQPFNGVPHLVAGRHAIVVFPQDSIDRLAGFIEGAIGDAADNDQDGDEASKGQSQLDFDAHETFSGYNDSTIAIAGFAGK